MPGKIKATAGERLAQAGSDEDGPATTPQPSKVRFMIKTLLIDAGLASPTGTSWR
jgi:hypothetical protein